MGAVPRLMGREEQVDWVLTEGRTSSLGFLRFQNQHMNCHACKTRDWGGAWSRMVLEQAVRGHMGCESVKAVKTQMELKFL